MNSISSKDQLRWVILLLAIAVILPTVCLLYFMTQAAKNERLAIRQKLIDTYTIRAQKFFIEFPDLYWNQAKDQVTSYESTTDKDILLFATVRQGGRFAGLAIYDPNDTLLWPIIQTPETTTDETEDIFSKAYQLEFQDANITAAMAEYETISSESDDTQTSFIANISQARCLNKLDQTQKAIDILSKLSTPEANINLAGRILQAKIFLAQIYADSKNDKLASNLRTMLSQSTYINQPYPTETKIWALDRLIKIVDLAGLSENLQKQIDLAKQTIQFEQVSLNAADVLKTPSTLKETFTQIETDPPSYCIAYTITDKKVVALITEDKMKDFWQNAVTDFEDEIAYCRIYDDKGTFIAGTPGEYLAEEVVAGTKFLKIAPGKNFPDWKVELYFHSGIFSDAAKRQQLIYIWTAALAITLMIFVTSFATKTLLRQAKLNTLKNDFIATITHELKTPLASMRVLVDTLLEGNYNDRQQATEYLQLISKENKRLTGLIDNFLTFSRMERNKQAFEIIATSPAEIAKDAAYALKTKFAQGSCDFTTTIPDNLPDIYADHDAMVTVLANLLDNAYKYSGDDKHIELSLYQHESSVFFKVKDNGKGMSPRVTRKIFDRFYQADSRLARSAEGCGLGLSIVKFIVDAHNANIEVTSKPDKGTEFTIILPIIKE